MLWMWVLIGAGCGAIVGAVAGALIGHSDEDRGAVDGSVHGVLWGALVSGLIGLVAAAVRLMSSGVKAEVKAWLLASVWVGMGGAVLGGPCYTGIHRARVRAEAMEMRHAFEAEMFLREWGPEQGSLTLLYLHGLGESGLCFEGLEGLGDLEGMRHLVPDLPGYGRSPWPEEPRSLVELVDHVARWMRARGEGRSILIGHSMGGVLATILAERHGDLVLGVVDVDGNISIADCAFSGRAAAQPLEEFVDRGFEALREEVYRQGLTDRAHRGYAASLCLADPRAYHLNSGELVALSEQEDLAPRLSRLAVPACYVAGIPHGASPRSLELLAEAGVRVLPISPAGHWPFVDEPEAFAAHIAGWSRLLPAR